ncbi:MAG: diguanylate cyclase [Pseudomonadota bacterium]
MLTPLNLNSLKTIIDASPKATLLTDREGNVLCVNSAARELLGVSDAPGTLNDLFESREQLRAALQSVLRCCGTVPLLVRQSEDSKPLHMQLQPLTSEQTNHASHLLVTLQTRTAASEKMRSLRQRLDDETAERRRLLRQNSRLRQTVEESIPRLKALAQTDELTGVFNRRYFDTQYAREWRRAVRQESELSLIYLDIDHFKAYNDGYGHPQGDECLKRICRALEKAVAREFDSICRIGGEEFAVLMPMTPAKGAIDNAQRLLRGVRRLCLAHPREDWPFVTISIGVGTCRPRPTDDPDAFVESVDKALYRAKQSGRDRLAGIPGMPVLSDIHQGTAGA